MEQLTYEDAILRSDGFHRQESEFILYRILAETIRQTELLERIANSPNKVVVDYSICKSCNGSGSNSGGTCQVCFGSGYIVITAQ